MLATVVCLSVMIVPMFECTVQAAELTVSEETPAVTRGGRYEWHYKDVDGQRYKRLWDITNQIWVTDWIPCD